MEILNTGTDPSCETMALNDEVIRHGSLAQREHNAAILYRMFQKKAVSLYSTELQPEQVMLRKLVNQASSYNIT